MLSVCHDRNKMIKDLKWDSNWQSLVVVILQVAISLQAHSKE